MNFINGYTIRPAATPFAMLYVKGINTMTKYAGKPSVQSEKSISRMASIIKAPTRISTGAVAAFGTKAMRGAKNKQRIKEERESAYLLNLYNEFVKENPIDINESEFDKVCKNSGSHLSGRDFFTLWSEEANAGL